jgi:hypothetical protein
MHRTAASTTVHPLCRRSRRSLQLSVSQSSRYNLGLPLSSLSWRVLPRFADPCQSLGIVQLHHKLMNQVGFGLTSSGYDRDFRLCILGSHLRAFRDDLVTPDSNQWNFDLMPFTSNLVLHPFMSRGRSTKVRPRKYLPPHQNAGARRLFGLKSERTDSWVEK